MEISKFPMLIVGVVVALVLAGAVMPIFGSVSAEEDKITNSDGYIRMTQTDSTDTTQYTIKWDKTNPNIIDVNGDKVQIKNIPNDEIRFNVVFNSSWLIRASSIAGTSNVSNLQYYTSSGGITSINNSMELTCLEGNFTMTYDSSSKTGTYNDLYIPDSNGAFVMKNRDKPAYVTGDSEVIGFGLTLMNSPTNPGSTISPGIGLLVDGSINEGVEIAQWRGITGYTLTNTTPNIHYSESKTWNNIYDLSEITFIATITNTSDGSITSDTSVSYSYFLVPYEVTGERIVHADATLKALIDLLPVLIIAGLVAGSIVWFITRK